MNKKRWAEVRWKSSISSESTFHRRSYSTMATVESIDLFLLYVSLKRSCSHLTSRLKIINLERELRVSGLVAIYSRTNDNRKKKLQPQILKKSPNHENTQIFFLGLRWKKKKIGLISVEFSVTSLWTFCRSRNLTSRVKKKKPTT